jgi:hypothetical protein
VEIQIDEYGGGQVHRMHQELFKRTMTALELHPTYGAYVDVAPAPTLCAPSQNGLIADLPHQHSATVPGPDRSPRRPACAA